MFKNIPALHDAVAVIERFFHNGVADVLTGLSALANSIAKNGGTVLLTAAASAVAAAEAQGGSGADKLKAAQATVIATLTAQGLPVVTNAINGAIEAAVAQHKANLAADAAVS
ncbi:phage holin, LLH family [Limnoglobus roseus]|uniref:Uncharacterized protein n=1 Tax=Limnoglobus roseus TaxID=2598579 RepID=A0A5C1A9A4_9BACT|nr:phage holin, LLH family [Limnoglobus roseus]QEL14807.1 hypothetical protein PX52LOC_01704 [Limnoglobus roseus]